MLSHRPETGIVWVDAHGDLNTPGTSPSGNVSSKAVNPLTKDSHLWLLIQGISMGCL